MMIIRTSSDAATDDAVTSFHEAVRKIAHLVNATHINEKGTTIAKFKTEYSTILDRTDEGSLEIITRSKRHYVILEEGQVLALANSVQPPRFAGDLLDDLQLRPATEARPRAISVNVPSLGRLPE